MNELATCCLVFMVSGGLLVFLGVCLGSTFRYRASNNIPPVNWPSLSEMKKRASELLKKEEKQPKEEPEKNRFA